MVRFGAATAPFVHPISTLLVDDCFAFRQGLKDLLDFYSLVSSVGSLHFQIVRQASSAQQAIALAIEQSPMLILLGLELSQGLCRKYFLVTNEVFRSRSVKR